MFLSCWFKAGVSIQAKIDRNRRPLRFHRHHFAGRSRYRSLEVVLKVLSPQGGLQDVR
jgi:hypothetical protein